jgi:hypothetical protein
LHSGRNPGAARHDGPAPAAAAHPCHPNHVLALIAAHYMRGYTQQRVGDIHNPRAHRYFTFVQCHHIWRQVLTIERDSQGVT